MSACIPGTVRDLASGIDLEGEHPFFGSVAEADRFVRAAILPNLGGLRRRVRLLDLGGGQGLLAAHCAGVLSGLGYEPEGWVVDANPAFLSDARKRGLNTHEADIACYAGIPADIVLMRLVLHYNPQPAQPMILANACRHLVGGGLMALQLESGDKTACALRNRLAALIGGWLGTGAGFWVDRESIFEWLREAGLCNPAHVMEPEYESDVVALVRNAWRRHRAQFDGIGVTQEEFYRACTDEIFAFRKETADRLYYKDGRLVLRTVCPIIVAAKAKDPSRADRQRHCFGDLHGDL